MSEEPSEGEATAPSLPRHLAALVGSIQGPEDLGRNHDQYLSFPDPRPSSDGAESA